MRREQDMVRDFHHHFNVEIKNRPTVPKPDILRLRVDLINEEAKEFAEAAERENLVLMVDALADILYVTLGAGVSLGVDLEKVFHEVHRSNMTKIWPDGTVHYADNGKVIKSPEYSPANIMGVLEEL